MLKCDVIIPVYNAYDAVKECIESVLKNTNFQVARIILINDKSTDERILPLLEDFEKKNKDKITLLKNNDNLGFVKTVNKGMKYSENDVLLLNSDTEVPSGWLDRIIECAYSDELIATVTPLSNNATLASVPKMFVRNELPEGYDLKKMDDLVRRCSLNLFPEIPTAHGFCMFIKRSVLNEVGFFDEKNFGKGYGEENDFSFRCFKYGYRNVLCDNVYVLHKESQSFQDKKVDNSIALATKHPELKNGLDYWCRVRDIQEIGDNIALKLGLSEVRPNILLIVHDFSNIGENVGGTTLHILDIIKILRNKYNFHVLAPENGVYKVHSFFKDSDAITNVYKKPVIIEPIGIKSNQYRKMLERIIDSYGISFVHVHHMIGQFFDIGDVCKEKKIKYAVSLHDFYLKTPIPSMVDESIDGSKKSPISIDVWRSACRDLMEGATEVIVPSEFTKKAYQAVYKKQKFSVIAHGVDVPDMKVEHDDAEEKNIAFVGAIFPHKGSDILIDMVKRIKKTDKIKIHLFGTTIVDLKNDKIFINHGKYNRKELPGLLKENKIDLLCAFSLAPETFAYTVEEVIAAGVPVVSFDIGAAAERIKQNNLGWVIHYTDNSDKITKSIKDILGNKKDYKEVLSSISSYHVKSVDEMADNYDCIYKKYVKAKDIDGNYLELGIITNDLITNVLRMSYGYRDEYFGIVNSLKWKIASKIKVPVRMKKMAKKIYKMVRR